MDRLLLFFIIAIIMLVAFTILAFIADKTQNTNIAQKLINFFLKSNERE